MAAVALASLMRYCWLNGGTPSPPRKTMAASNATAFTRRPEIVKALNYCLAQTGCTKDQAISMVVLTLTEAGIPLRNALDAVVGPGTYQMISDTTWEALQPA